MCGKSTDYKVIVTKQDGVSFYKYNLVVLVLFSITCSALGLSCYAVLRVQIISDDLNGLRLLLSRNKVKSLGDDIFNFSDNQNWGDSSGSPNDESPVLRKIVEGHSIFSERSKRSLLPESSNTIELLPSQTTETGEFPTTNEVIEEASSTPYGNSAQFPSSEDRKYNLHHIKKKAVDYEENVETETFTPQYQVPVYRHRHRGRNNNQLEIIDEFSPQAGRLKSLIAIHFDGDTSKYVYGRHSNFNGNGHLRHPKKTFVDWKESEWVESIGTGTNFASNDGVVSVREAGLYFVYSQIYYLDEHDMNGYRVYKNSDILLQCTTFSHSTDRMMKGNTCYTAGVTYLDANDNISISDITDGRYSLFEPGKSFFGMIKLGDAKRK